MKNAFKLVVNLIFAVLLGNASASAMTCSGLFVRVDNLPSTREVLLEPGDTVYGRFTCTNCSTLASARPNTFGKVQCPTCGTKPKSADFRPPETIERGGRLYLLEPGNLVAERDGLTYGARSERGWTCGFCNAANFQVSIKCSGCGEQSPTRVPPFSVASAQARQFSDWSSSAQSAAARSTMSTAIPTVTSLNLAQPGAVRKSFLRTRAGALLMSAVGLGASGFIWWGTQTYTLPAEVTSITATTAYVTYREKNGESRSIDITPPNSSVSIKDWRVGDKVTLYFRNLGGAKGVEGFDGQVFKAGSTDVKPPSVD